MELSENLLTAANPFLPLPLEKTPNFFFPWQHAAKYIPKSVRKHSNVINKHVISRFHDIKQISLHFECERQKPFNYLDYTGVHGMVQSKS